MFCTLECMQTLGRSPRSNLKTRLLLCAYSNRPDRSPLRRKILRVDLQLYPRPTHDIRRADETVRVGQRVFEGAAGWGSCCEHAVWQRAKRPLAAWGAAARWRWTGRATRDDEGPPAKTLTTGDCVPGRNTRSPAHSLHCPASSLSPLKQSASSAHSTTPRPESPSFLPPLPPRP